MKPFRSLCPWLTEPLAMLEAAAGSGRLGHGWLISGPAGIGKRNLAYVLAGRLLEGEAGKPMPEAARPREIVGACRALAEASDLHPDLHRVRPEEDKRSIAVDQIRATISGIGLTPHVANKKIVIIEAAESMTTAAANALLKSLEEPTANTWLFLLAERIGRLPATIRSRCQQLPLKAPDVETTVRWLAQDGLDARGLPRTTLTRSPLNAARAAEDNDNNYKKIADSLNMLYHGRADPHAIAQAWHRSDPELLLGCLADSLRSRIRYRLVPDRWTPITDTDAPVADNDPVQVPIGTLFEGLEMAENVREQIGRGINVELALEALLLGLAPSQSSRVDS